MKKFNYYLIGFFILHCQVLSALFTFLAHWLMGNRIMSIDFSFQTFSSHQREILEDLLPEDENAIAETEGEE